MKLDKHSQLDDKKANLYRSALYLAQGNQKQALYFIQKSSAPEMTSNINNVLSETQQKFWAEKILDRYFDLDS